MLLAEAFPKTFLGDTMPRCRELREDEFHRIRELPPFSGVGAQIPQPNSHRVWILESPEGEIIGLWGCFLALHAEPLWIADGYRKRPGVLRRLYSSFQRALGESGASVAFAIIEDANLPLLGDQPGRLGFERAPGNLYYLALERKR